LTRGLSLFVRSAEKLAPLDPQRSRNPSEHGDARRHIAELDHADIAGAQAGAPGQLLLRHLLIAAFPTQVVAMISWRSVARSEPEQE
jgi:hypothetical protein